MELRETADDFLDYLATGGLGDPPDSETARQSGEDLGAAELAADGTTCS